MRALPPSALPESLMAELNDEFDFAYSESWAVYADLLLEHDHRLGAQIAANQQTYLRDPAARESDELSGPPTFIGDGRHGFWRSLEVDYCAAEDEALRLFLGDESCRFLQELSITVVDDPVGLLKTITESPFGLQCLASLRLDLIDDNAHLSQDTFSRALARFPKLVKLSLVGQQAITGLSSATLLELSIEAGSIIGLGREGIALPKVTHLTLQGEDVDFQVQCSGLGMPALTHLRLLCSRSKILSELANIRLIPRLKQLEIPLTFSEGEAMQLCQLARQYGLTIEVSRAKYSVTTRQQFLGAGLRFRSFERGDNEDDDREVEFRFGEHRWCEVDWVRASRGIFRACAKKLRTSHPKDSDILRGIADVGFMCSENVLKDDLRHALQRIEREHRWLLSKYPQLQELLACCRRHDHPHGSEAEEVCTDMLSIDG